MLLSALMLFASTASAQMAAGWSFHGTVLAPDPAVPYLATALHHPAVDWDATRLRALMVFATDQPGHPDCPEGVTGLGLAGSSDGRRWSFAPGPLALPDPTSAAPGACRITEPAVLYDEVADSFHVWFVAEGIGNVSEGIGHLELQLDAAGNPIWPPSYSGLVHASATLREPSVLLYQDTYLMALAEYPNIVFATGPTATGLTLLGVGLDAADYDMGATAWLDGDFLRASLTCKDTGAFPLEAFSAGYDGLGGWGIGKAVASPVNLTNWALAVDPQFVVPSTAEFGGFDIVRHAAADYVGYVANNGRIKATSTLPLGTPTPVPGYKRCP